MFIIPESLTRVAMRRARRRRERVRKREETALEQFVGQPWAIVIKARILSILKKPLGFLAPLGVFLPYRRPGGKGWDYNLTFVVLSSACECVLMVSQFKTRAGSAFLRRQSRAPMDSLFSMHKKHLGGTLN